MVLDHGLDDSKHEHILGQVLSSVNCGLLELGALSHHEFEQVIELGRAAQAVLDKVFVHGDRLNYVDDSLDVELA